MQGGIKIRPFCWTRIIRASRVHQVACANCGELCTAQYFGVASWHGCTKGHQDHHKAIQGKAVSLYLTHFLRISALCSRGKLQNHDANSQESADSPSALCTIQLIIRVLDFILHLLTLLSNSLIWVRCTLSHCDSLVGFFLLDVALRR